MILCPRDGPEHAFYLRPVNHPTTSCWYSKQPLSHTKLSTTVVRLCESAGIQGHKTNHSFRATTTTRLYHSGVDEQLVMERTGHRSLQGVHSYKRTSDTQRESLSDILNPKQPRVHTVASVSQLPPSNSTAPTCIPTTASQKNEVLRGLSLPSATFNGCTVNFFIGTSSSVPGSSDFCRKDSSSDTTEEQLVILYIHVAIYN